MTQPIAQFAHRQHGPVTTAALVLLFWGLAAALVFAVHITVEPLSTQAASIATIAVLVVIAWLYSRLVASEAGASHALGVGIAWLVLSIAAEFALAAFSGHGWFYLLGSPEHPLLRNLCLFAWIFAPVAFARRASE